MADQHQNFAYSLVATAPSPASSGPSLVVTAADGAKFPAVPFNATIWPASAQPTTANAEIVRVTAISTDTFTITRAQESSSARSVVIGDQIAATVTVKTITDAENTPYSARSSNTILALSDKGSSIVATAAYTQTLTAAATLGAGWWCVLTNGTQDGTSLLVVDPNASETIDTLTTVTMYSGETRLIECDGSNFFSQMIDGGYAKFTPTGGNFVVPAGITALDVVCIGSGGQGGGGGSSVGAGRSGGAGGGGGAVSRAILRASDFSAGATVTVTVGAGGSASGGGGAAGAGATGSNGSDGSVTSFGTALKAGGGGGGPGGQGSSTLGGGGASVITSAVGAAAGSPNANPALSGQGATAISAQVGKAAEWGGGSGGGANGSTSSASFAGGDSIFGGPGGGSGGGVNASNVGVAGAAGGGNQVYTSGGGAGGGGGGASPQGGTSAASDTPSPYCGRGGGGGGAGSAGAGGGANGGPGGIGGGGGGGGAGSNTASSGNKGGNGGAGGAGECRVWYS